MRCPTLAELPPPPPGKAGWPWTIESPQLPNTTPDGRPWPRISIVTPSFNQGQFIEETIRSVLLQGYPDLEYVIFDAASTDDSVGIIKKYEPWLTYWESEKDRGQAHAINKGLTKSTGEIFNWINSDDMLVDGALGIIARCFGSADAVAGGVSLSDGEKAFELYNSGLDVPALMRRQCVFMQPGVWLRRPNMQRLGLFFEKMHYCFDKYYIIKYFEQFPNIVYDGSIFVKFRLHKDSKTVAHAKRFDEEHDLMVRFLRFELVNEANRRVAQRLSDKIFWYRQLSRAIRASDGRLTRISFIIWVAARRPRQRMRRPLFGAIRRILLGNQLSRNLG